MIFLITIFDAGPYIFPFFLLLLVGVALLSSSLIDAGLCRSGWKRWVCLTAGVPLAMMVVGALLMLALA